MLVGQILSHLCIELFLWLVFCPSQELRELTKLDGVACLVRQEELELSRTPESLEELKRTRAKNKIDALLNKVRRQLRISPWTEGRCDLWGVHPLLCGKLYFRRSRKSDRYS